jgi:hypothetical protein
MDIFVRRNTHGDKSEEEKGGDHTRLDDYVPAPDRKQPD